MPTVRLACRAESPLRLAAVSAVSRCAACGATRSRQACTPEGREEDRAAGKPDAVVFRGCVVEPGEVAGGI